MTNPRLRSKLKRIATTQGRTVLPNRLPKPITKSAPAWLMATAVFLSACSTSPRDMTPHAGARVEIVQAALGHLDTPYRYGGTDAGGLDCSALVQRAYRQIGRNIPRSSHEQARAARRVSPSRMQPGDVVFFATRGRRIDHVGIYIGDGRFVHAPNSRSRVRIEPLDNPYWQPRLRFAGHFL